MYQFSFVVYVTKTIYKLKRFNTLTHVVLDYVTMTLSPNKTHDGNISYMKKKKKKKK